MEASAFLYFGVYSKRSRESLIFTYLDLSREDHNATNDGFATACKMRPNKSEIIHVVSGVARGSIQPPTKREIIVIL